MGFEQRLIDKLGIMKAEVPGRAKSSKDEPSPGIRYKKAPVAPPTPMHKVKYKGSEYLAGGTTTIAPSKLSAPTLKPETERTAEPGGAVEPQHETGSQVVRTLLHPKLGKGQVLGYMTPTGKIVKAGEEELVMPGEPEKPERKKSGKTPKMPEPKGWDITWTMPYLGTKTGETILLDNPKVITTIRPCSQCKGAGQIGIDPVTKNYHICPRCYGVGSISDYIDRIVSSRKAEAPDVNVSVAHWGEEGGPRFAVLHTNSSALDELE